MRAAGACASVVGPTALAAMKTVAAVDSGAIEPKQRADLVAMVRQGVVDVNAVSRLRQDDAGVEHARYFIALAREAQAHRFQPPRQKLPLPKPRRR